MKKILILSIFIIFLTGCEVDLKKFISSIEEISSSYEKSTIEEDYFTYEEVETISKIMPSTGNINSLIIPITFNDSNTTDKYSISNINNLFFSENLSYESLSTYYQKSSYNKLNIKGDILGYQKLNNNKRYYLSYESSDYYKTSDIILNEVLNNNNLNLSDYDSNSDKVIDSLYLIYNTSNEEPLNSSYNECNITIDDYLIKGYVTLNVNDMYTNSYLNPLTLIKLTSKLLGIFDYYDNSNRGSEYGVGLSDITCGNLVDHNPLTKTLLGWTKPEVIVRGERYITLKPFETSGNTVILNASYGKNGLYDEYFIIDFFTNTGLNRINPLNENGGGYSLVEINNGLNIYKETYGLRIYHVNTTKEEKELLYNNQTTNYSLLSLVTKDDILKNNTKISSDVLFYESDIFDSSTLNSNELINTFNKRWKIQIESIVENECLLKIEYAE